MNVKIIAEVWPEADFKTKLDSGDISEALLFGTNGGDGLIINTDWDNLRKSLDGTRVLIKTRSADDHRVQGVSDPVQALMSRASEEGLNYTLYSDKPCELNDGIYTYLEDDTDWGSSALPSIYTELEKEAWRSEVE